MMVSRKRERKGNKRERGGEGGREGVEPTKKTRSCRESSSRRGDVTKRRLKKESEKNGGNFWLLDRWTKEETIKSSWLGTEKSGRSPEKLPFTVALSSVRYRRHNLTQR